MADRPDQADRTSERDADTAASEEPPHYAAEKVRGGEIILRTRIERLIFLAGLVGATILAVVLAFSGR